jgi:uncharacterized membrane protein YcaP (DUF421 family)
MSSFTPVDWPALFTFDTPVLEIIVRGSIMYISLFILLRVILKRQAGTVGITDLLVIVLIADAAQNGMAGDYKSLPDGILLVTTLIFWNYIFEWLGFHFALMDKIFSPPPLLLIKHGRIIEQNIKKELISKEDLASHLRQQGIDKIKDVKHAYLEGDGKISVIQYGNQQNKKERDSAV